MCIQATKRALLMVRKTRVEKGRGKHTAEQWPEEIEIDSVGRELFGRSRLPLVPGV